MNGHLSTNYEIICKIKNTPWDDYKQIKCPRTFKNLIRELSRLFFPNNFTIRYYLQDEVITMPITSEKDYSELMNIIRLCGYNEIVLFIDVYKRSPDEKLPIIYEVNEDASNAHRDVNNVGYRKFCKYIKCI
jgi:hypothetical protein